MLDHLEQPLSVHRVDVYLGLKSTYFGRPRHRLSRASIRPELHQTFIQGVEVTLVLYMGALLNLIQLATRAKLFL
jgi:hypothetical protein